MSKYNATILLFIFTIFVSSCTKENPDPIIQNESKNKVDLSKSIPPVEILDHTWECPDVSSCDIKITLFFDSDGEQHWPAEDVVLYCRAVGSSSDWYLVDHDEYNNSTSHPVEICFPKRKNTLVIDYYDTSLLREPCLEFVSLLDNGNMPSSRPDGSFEGNYYYSGSNQNAVKFDVCDPCG